MDSPCQDDAVVEVVAVKDSDEAKVVEVKEENEILRSPDSASAAATRFFSSSMASSNRRFSSSNFCRFAAFPLRRKPLPRHLFPLPLLLFPLPTLRHPWHPARFLGPPPPRGLPPFALRSLQPPPVLPPRPPCRHVAASRNPPLSRYRSSRRS